MQCLFVIQKSDGCSWKNNTEWDYYNFAALMPVAMVIKPTLTVPLYYRDFVLMVLEFDTPFFRFFSTEKPNFPIFAPRL